MSKSRKTLVAAVLMAGGVSSTAIADGYEYEPVAKSFAPPPADSWTGVYVGLNAGWIQSDSDAKPIGSTGDPMDALLAAGRIPRVDNRNNGLLGGLQLGANWQSGKFVIGVEGDIGWTSLDDDASADSPSGAFAFFAPTTLSNEMPWFATTRLRAGVLATPKLLLYATGGAAFARVEHRISQDGILAANGNVLPNISTSGSTKDTKAGWTIGGGGEWSWGTQWSIKTEYLYYDLDDSKLTSTSATVPGNTLTWDIENTGHLVRVGINFKLQSPSPPVPLK